MIFIFFYLLLPSPRSLLDIFIVMMLPQWNFNSTDTWFSILIRVRFFFTQVIKFSPSWGENFSKESVFLKKSGASPVRTIAHAEKENRPQCQSPVQLACWSLLINNTFPSLWLCVLAAPCRQ